MSCRSRLLCNGFSTDVLKNGVAAACAEYRILLIAYSPIGRGATVGEMSPSCLKQLVRAFTPKPGANSLELGIYRPED